jgi:uncharacterized membrane protein (UPF0182 family)
VLGGTLITATSEEGRGSIIALPVSGGFLYVESIYIQATEARMPQLKKVVLAMGNRLIYRDTFGEALAELTGGPTSTAPALAAVTSSAPACGGHWARLTHAR